jgi:hypothetical protein
MSLPPVGPHSIPEETVRLARTICPKGTLYMHIRDQLGVELRKLFNHCTKYNVNADRMRIEL